MELVHSSALMVSNKSHEPRARDMFVNRILTFIGGYRRLLLAWRREFPK
jgi:hypothetical protein